MRLEGRTVLLTGASGGLGAAIARALAERGARLVLTGRRADALAALAEETGGRAVSADLAEPDAPARLVEEAGDVDVLVANAALPASGRLEDFSPDDIDRALTVNLRAPIVLARLLLEPMLARGDGHLVFISSLNGKVATHGSGLYSATKFGLRGFALALAQDLHGRGVGVSTVFPGFIRDAGMFAASGAKLPPGVGTRSPEEVGETVVRAIERNRLEAAVAPLSLRAGAAFAGLAPGVSAAFARRAGSERIAREMAEGQRDRR